ncbi:dihydrofolate reductase family protein [soil metagenome]
MRKLKLQVQMSIDTFVAGPNGEMDWMVWNWDQRLKDFVLTITNPIDTILLGRNMVPGFIDHWAKAAADSKNPDNEFAYLMDGAKKVVFTKSLAKSEWPRTTLAKGDIVEEVNNLKKQSGKDLIVYGGAKIVSSLITNNLIDEYYLFIKPTAIGNGMPIFSGKHNLKLQTSTAFDCGIVVLHYKP